MRAELRLATRRLLRQPGFTATAVLILALATGATTAMFSVTNTLTLAPLPYPDPERLVRLYRTVESDRGFPNPHAQSAFEDYRRMATVFEGVTAFAYRGVSAAERPGSQGRPVRALQVAANFFLVHGMSPMLGRWFQPGEDRAGSPRTVVISWHFWQSAFGGAADVVGRPVQLNDGIHTVVGVMPRAFNDLRRAWGRVDLWYPLAIGPPPAGDRDNHWLQIVARLGVGQTVATAQAQLDAVCARLNAQHGGRGGVQVLPLGDTGVNEAEARATQLTLGLAILVLVIACLNLAGLQLARLAGRQHDDTIRLALGAGRRHLVRQLLTESFLLCLVGGLFGLLVASWMVDAISSKLVLFGTPAGITIALDRTALVFAGAVLALTTLAVSLLPAWLGLRSTLAGTLRAAGRSAAGGRQPRWLHGFVLAEMALALVLLAAGGLFVRGLDRFIGGSQGWKVDGLLAGTVSLRQGSGDDPRRQMAFLEQLRASVARVPSVDSVSLSDGLPISIFATNQAFRVEGRAPLGPGQAPISYMHVVSPEYFATLGMAVERGRDFLATDGPDGQPVVIVNQAMARALWPGEDPIGKRIGPAVGPARWATVVGVVSDVGAAAELREPITRFRAYAPLRQNPRPWLTLVVRTRSPATTAREIRQALTNVDPSLSSFEARSVRGDVDLLLANLSMLARLLLGFALLGLTLAALGIYGLFAGFVIQRTREIGLRMALGARAAQVLWLVLGRGLRLALAGAVLGLAGSYAAVRLLTSMATELPVYEPAALVVLPVTLLAVALLACWLPARRAARVDPMVALRAD